MMDFWNLLIQEMVEAERISMIKMGLDKLMINSPINRY